jgi:hypothetical protein
MSLRLYCDGCDALIERVHSRTTLTLTLETKVDHPPVKTWGTHELHFCWDCTRRAPALQNTEILTRVVMAPRVEEARP